jgi:hypothetical protein
MLFFKQKLYQRINIKHLTDIHELPAFDNSAMLIALSISNSIR